MMFFFHSAVANSPCTQTHGEVTGVRRGVRLNLTEDKHYSEDPKQLQSTQQANIQNLLLIVLTSRQWEELFHNDSLMKSSRVFGWLV